MKVVAIHQPNYLPWMGYFYKILSSDVFVFLDSVDFQHGNASSLINRAKIKTHNGMQLLTVPVKRHNEGKAINQINLDNAQPWQKKQLTTIKLSYSKSPYFKDVFPIIENVLSASYTTLADINIAAINHVLDYLDIHIPRVVASTLDISTQDRNMRLVEICKKLGGNIYLSGKGGKKYNDEALYAQNNLSIKYSDFTQPEYPQLHGAFIPHLSIIDVLFNCGKDTIKLLERN